jgi:hypothetical protein
MAVTAAAHDSVTSTRPPALGPYRILGEIGRGAHGVVYKAHLAGSPGHPVALKVVESRGDVERLLVEPEILSRLDHPGIVRLLDFFLHEGDLVLALELVVGTDLQTYLSGRGPADPDEVRDFLVQMAEALAHSHGLGILHRDIKLTNVLVDLRGDAPRYVLTDFGISRLSGGIQVKRRGGGTYQFMAPEQLRGRPVEQSDLWSLGVVAYRMRTGQLPFDAPRLDELSDQILFQSPRPPAEAAGRADPALDAVVMHLLEKQLVHRTGSAAALRDQLAAARPGRREVRAPRPRDGATPEPIPRHEVGLRRAIARRTAYFVLAVILYILPEGVLPSLLVVAGACLFFRAQATRRDEGDAAPMLLAGLASIFLGFLATLGWTIVAFPIGARWLAASFNASEDLAGIALELGVVIYQVVFACVAMYHLVAVRELRRDLFLSRELRSGGVEHLLDRLAEYLDVHSNDVTLRQKYAEALLSAGRVKDAVVECQLILEADAYNFGATLLLAHGLLALGLRERCVQVCNSYLAVTSYCFELEDLKRRAERAAG